MAKVHQVYSCRSCGALQTKWLGKCPDCGSWDSLEAERIEPKARVDPRGAAITAFGESESGGAAGAAARRGAAPMHEVGDGQAATRIATGIGEFDRVLGGGFVPGSAILLGGDPGIGKSTLLLQAARSLAGRGTRTLYVTSEESAEQVKLRAARLVAAEKPGDPPDGESDLYLLADTSLSRIIEQASKVLGSSRHPVMVIDSIQMIYKSELDAAPGSITQLRRCAAELVYFAKASGVAVVLVGHVTKDGSLAGPRLLEHVVDAVLYFEGDRYHAHRLVRAVKNRFGSTLELGLFEMTDRGLVPVPEGATFAAMGGHSAARPGSVVCPVLTGSRCLLVEIQALTATGFLGAARRKCSGLDPNRLAMIIAVLEQHAGLRLADRDVFASAVGGVRVAEPAADLALALAIAGAHHKRSLAPGTAVIGEVGLGGEVRPVSQTEARVREAAKLGFKTVLVPRLAGRAAMPKIAGVEVIQLAELGKAIDLLG